MFWIYQHVLIKCCIDFTWNKNSECAGIVWRGGQDKLGVDGEELVKIIVGSRGNMLVVTV